MSNWRFILNSSERGEHELLHEPKNWRDRETKLVRDMKYYGISREITSPIILIKEAAAYLKDVFNLSGFNANVTLRVFEFNAESKRYESYFSGQLIMKSIEIRASEVEVMATPNTIQERIKSRGNVEISYDSTFSIGQENIFGAVPVAAMLHSRLIKKMQSVTWSQSKGIPLASGQKLQIGFDEFPVDELKGWIKERVTIASSEVFPIYKAEEGGEHHFDILFALGSNSGFGDEIQFYYAVNSLDAPVAVATDYHLIIDPPLQYSYFIVQLDLTIALQAGDTFYFYGVAAKSFNATLGISGLSRNPLIPADRFHVTADTYAQPAEVSGFLAFDLFNQGLKAMTDQRSILSSNILGRTTLGYAQDGAAALNLITSGANLAGNPGKIKGSFNALFDAFKGMYNIGLAVVDQLDGTESVVIEEMSYFFQQRVGITITEVWDIRKRVAEDLVYNLVLAGFNDYDSDFKNTQDDYCTENSYVIPALHVNKTLDIRSKIIASPYAIEQKKRENSASGMNKKYDNNLFVVSLVREGEGYKARSTEGFELVENVEDPESCFNLDLHTGRCLQRHGAYLNSLFYKAEGLVGFASSGSESDLITLKPGEKILRQERASVDSMALEEPLWLPEIYEFEAKLTVAQDRVLVSRMFEITEVVTPYEKLYGYLLERNRKENNEVSFTLLRANYNG